LDKKKELSVNEIREKIFSSLGSGRHERKKRKEAVTRRKAELPR